LGIKFFLIAEVKALLLCLPLPDKTGIVLTVPENLTVNPIY